MGLSRYIQFEKQSTFTDETFGAFGANKHNIDPIGEDISGDHQWIYPKTAGQRPMRKRISGTKTFSGTVDTPLYPIHAVSLLYYLMGTVTSAVSTPTTTNLHTIKKSNSVPFFRAAIGRDLKEHQYVGGIVNSVTIDYTPDDILTGSFNVVLRREKSPLANLDTGLTFSDFDNVEAAFGGVEVSPELDDSAVNFIESASITIENNVAEDAFALGSPYLPAGIIAQLGVTGTFDLRYDSSARYTDWLDGTKRKLELIASRGTGSSTRKLTIELPVISYDVNRLPTDNIERYVQTLEFTGETDSNGDPVIITVQNAQTNAQFAG
jgi:hypothetical protein